MHGGEPWFIDLSEAIRIDRVGYSAWVRQREARGAVNRGLESLATYFRRYGLAIDVEAGCSEILRDTRGTP
jgi:serine/threonine-protein kinase RIO1